VQLCWQYVQTPVRQTSTTTKIETWTGIYELLIVKKDRKLDSDFLICNIQYRPLYRHLIMTPVDSSLSVNTDVVCSVQLQKQLLCRGEGGPFPLRHKNLRASGCRPSLKFLLDL